MENEEVLYHVEPQDNFEAEGRYFYKGERYPVLKKNENFVILTSENGAFNFRETLMDDVIEQWELIVHDNQ